jgi:peptidoglycan/xylan/chitin deacetylase (PgdA/CDA1 family)
MYHRFSSNPEPFKTSQKVFEQQLKFLRARYNFIKFEDYLYALSSEHKSLPSNPLLITIDDGYTDNYRYAYPVLMKHKVPATIFLSTDFISNRAWLWSNRLEYTLKNSQRTKFSYLLGDREASYQVDSFIGWHKAQLDIFNYCRTLANADKDLFLDQLALDLKVSVPDEVTSEFQPLTWGQIKEMQNNGISYGSHGHTHSICSRLSSADLLAELVVSKNEIEKNVSVPVEVFCYPNGQPEDYSSDVVRQVENVGYRAAVTTVVGSNVMGTSTQFSLKRFSLGLDDLATISHTLTI